MDTAVVSDRKKRFQEIVDGLDENDIYRSIYDREGNIIKEGIAAVKQELLNDYSKVDFKGKTVIDLGSNFGFFTFLTARLGAVRVTGLDCLPEVVEGANHLAAFLDYDNVAFRTFNIEKPVGDLGKFDVAMLLDFFGKSNIRKQKVQSLLEFLKTLSDTELLMVFRPINRIDNDLQLTQKQFKPLYPQKYVKTGNFYLVDYIKDNMAPEWEMQAISDYRGEVSKDKLLFHFAKKLTQK